MKKPELLTGELSMLLPGGGDHRRSPLGAPGIARGWQWRTNSCASSPWKQMEMLRTGVFPAVSSFSAGKTEAREALNQVQATS